MKGSSEGKAAAHPERRERSRSRDATVHVSHCTKGSSKGKAAANPDRRERSPSRDVASPQGEAVHGKTAAHPERRERSRSRDATIRALHSTKGSRKGKAAANPDRRERSRDVARPQGEAIHPHIRQDEVQRIRQIREATRLSEQICCRDLRCGNHSFEVFVADPNRPEFAELMCVECGTSTGIDLERRLMYAFFNSQRSSISNNSSRSADVRREQRGA